MQAKEKSYNVITASTELSLNPARFARLKSKDYWCGKKLPYQTVSVDLGKIVTISGLATQGSDRGKATSYKLRYSYDDRSWFGYPSNTSLVV